MLSEKLEREALLVVRFAKVKVLSAVLTRLSVPVEVPVVAERWKPYGELLVTVVVMILLSALLPGARLLMTRSPPDRVNLIVFATVTEALADDDSAWVGLDVVRLIRLASASATERERERERERVEVALFILVILRLFMILF